MNHKFNQFREQYPTFIFDSFKIEKLKNTEHSQFKDPDNTDKNLEAKPADVLRITYNFLIPELAEFHPYLELPLKDIEQPYDEHFLKTIAFNLGMVEAISYYKATCSPTFIIKAGFLRPEQLQFFQKLYFHGLGEFLYLNNVETTETELVHFVVDHEPESVSIPKISPSGNLITVGGGKDSCVSLELLRSKANLNTCFALNPKQANLACIKTSGYPAIYAKRTIDPELLRLNQAGFLNGHTPFSAMLAFTTYLVACLTNRKYIIMSNEGSANQATVHNTKINHQYSKTYEFENDFNNYVSQFLSPEIHYFSFLRPLTEFQIGMIFANNERLKNYHKIFKSCNVGSKDPSWNWCGNCPKCLFVYIILSAFLTTEELIDIFGRDLYENHDLLQTFTELLGYSDRKPFECVGTYEECRLAVSLAIRRLENNHQTLPYLLQYYKDNYPLTFELTCGCNNQTIIPASQIATAYNSENNLPPDFAEIIKQELAKYDPATYRKTRA